MHQERIVLDDVIADQVFLNDALDHGRHRTVIPDAVRIHNQDRTSLTDPQTVGLGPENTAWAIGCHLIEVELLQSALQVVPGFNAGGFIATFGIGLIGADKHMPLDLSQS